MAASSLDAFLWAIGQQESGGNYSSVNSGSGALGKYQVMPANIPSWTKRALGHSVSTSEYLHSPAEQEAVARTVLGGYYAKYGAAGAAAAWYSGQPDPNKTYGNPPVYKYVASVLALMAKAPASAGGGSTATTTTPPIGDGVDTTGSSTAQDALSIGASKPPNCLFGFGAGFGYVCLLTYGQARALLGGLLLVGGGIVSAGGLIILASYGIKKSGALDQVAAAAGVIPGAGGVAAGAAKGSARIKASGTGAPARQAAKKTPAPAAPAKTEGGGGDDGNQ